MQTTGARREGFLGGCLATAAIVAVMLVTLSPGAFGAVVQTSYRTINNGTADFGSGVHAAGTPLGSATITYDWNTGGGQLLVTGRVRGTLYWDALVGAGCARLTIRFRNAANANLLVRQLDRCGPGGDANNSQNQRVVDESATFAALDKIVLTVEEVGAGSPVSRTITQVETKTFPVLINNGRADFGSDFLLGHHFGHPDNPGRVGFTRNGDGTLTGGVNGVLYYDAPDASSCSQMFVNYRNSGFGVLRHLDVLNCGPGGDANLAANEFFVLDGLTSGSLDRIQLIVQDTAAPTNGVARTFNVAGQVGEFELDPADAEVAANDVIHLVLSWTVPEPLTWHDLESLELRIVDDGEPILHIRWEEATDAITVLNEATGRPGPDSSGGSDGRQAAASSDAAGAGERLQSRDAVVDLDQSSAGPIDSPLGTGANSPTVSLDLALRFKPSVAGKSYRIEVAARDDFGNEDPFAVAGTLTIAP